MFLAEKYKQINTCSKARSFFPSGLQCLVWMTELPLAGAEVWLQADEHAYLVNAGKILDNEAEKNPGEQSPSHLQGASQQVVPGGALSQQPRQRTIK